MSGIIISGLSFDDSPEVFVHKTVPWSSLTSEVVAQILITPRVLIMSVPISTSVGRLGRTIVLLVTLLPLLSSNSSVIVSLVVFREFAP